jgi:hypothetical protein
LVVAPFLGGVLTDKVTWSTPFLFWFSDPTTAKIIYLSKLPYASCIRVNRVAGWCFWINLPLGGLTLFITFFLVQLPRQPAQNAAISWRQFVQKIDLLGNMILLPALVCLLLALQWGGTTYAWNSWRCILLLCIFGILSLVWAYIQARGGENSTVPKRLLKERSIVAATWFAFCLFGMLFVQSYYVPIWFQGAGGDSAYTAGISKWCSSSPSPET